MAQLVMKVSGIHVPRLHRARVKQLEHLNEEWMCCPESKQQLIDGQGVQEFTIDLSCAEDMIPICAFCGWKGPIKKSVRIVGHPIFTRTWFELLDIDESPMVESAP